MGVAVCRQAVRRRPLIRCMPSESSSVAGALQQEGLLTRRAACCTLEPAKAVGCGSCCSIGCRQTWGQCVHLLHAPDCQSNQRV